MLAPLLAPIRVLMLMLALALALVLMLAPLVRMTASLQLPEALAILLKLWLSVLVLHVSEIEAFPWGEQAPCMMEQATLDQSLILVSLVIGLSISAT